MAAAPAANFDNLYRACGDGDEATVRYLLPRISVKDLNRQQSNGRTCLHEASSCGHKNIVDLLLDHGASRLIRDNDDRTPLAVAKNEEIVESFPRPAEDVVQRYDVDSRKQPQWLFGQDRAELYSRAIHRGCVKDRGVKKTVEKIEHADFLLNNDESKEGRLLRYYLTEAREKNDPTFLVKAFTLNSLFYRAINEYMATGGSREVYKKLCRKWSGYYTGVLMKHPALVPYHFAGITYRGMVIDQDAFNQYQIGVVLTNKAFQSTSRLRDVALQFAKQSRRTPGQVSVMIRYELRDKKSALDIKTISEFPNEEEVLMVPGNLFRVDDVDTSVQPYDIRLRQLPWTHA